MTRLPIRPALISLGAAALLLSGCTAVDTSGAVRVDDGPATLTAAEVAAAAEGVVAEQGFTVEIDCGTDDIPFEVGTVVECAGVDPATGETGTYTVTITSIDGTDYGIEVVGSAAPGPTEPASAIEAIDAFTGFVVDTLTPSLGEQPVVDCGTEDIEIFLGQEVRCSYETSSNSAFIVVTVSDFDGLSYGIEIVEE